MRVMISNGKHVDATNIFAMLDLLKESRGITEVVSPSSSPFEFEVSATWGETVGLPVKYFCVRGISSIGGMIAYCEAVVLFEGCQPYIRALACAKQKLIGGMKIIEIGKFH